MPIFAPRTTQYLCKMNKPLNSWQKEMYRLFEQQIKFAIASAIATLVDYTLYLLFTLYFFFAPVPSNIVSSFCGMVVNFLLHKRMVFTLQRKVHHAFMLSLLISVGGIGLGTFIIYLLTQEAFFLKHQYITKLIATGIVFFYNFYFKQYAFEKRIGISKKMKKNLETSSKKQPVLPR
ncbi:GtrA family protein [Sphingobacteriales bacterium UPWRP_1]|nr:hypothetical protein BVG80_08500 [Sphingobacteriales bacterium TSM_CSM]PSJ72904.1 GtrA family protein [Sphingobacteriales bacterium UPWRP_1]